MSQAQADLALLSRYVDAGDPEAFDQIVRRYASMVYNTCWRVLRDSGRAEEVCQDTFFKLMTKPGSVKRSLGGWLHRTATTGSLDVLRSENARRKRERAYAHEAYTHPSAKGTWQALSPLIDQALNELPNPARVLLVEHFLDGKTQRQLAQELRVSPATISRRISDALDGLRRRLAGKGFVLAAGTLGALFTTSASAAQAVPATLTHELGKMSMVSGQTVGVGLGGSVSTGAIVAATAGGMLLLVVAIWLAITMSKQPQQVSPPGAQDVPAKAYRSPAAP